MEAEAEAERASRMRDEGSITSAAATTLQFLGSSRIHPASQPVSEQLRLIKKQV